MSNLLSTGIIAEDTKEDGIVISLMRERQGLGSAKRLELVARLIHIFIILRIASLIGKDYHQGMRHES